MQRTRIILLVSAIALIALIFSLPKVVVNNNPDEAIGVNLGDSSIESNVHEEEISEKVAEKASDLKEQINNNENLEKSITFADSLAKLYLSINKYDSAAKFFEFIAVAKPGVAQWQRAGNTYYDAYGFAMDRGKQEVLGQKARKFFTKLLEVQPNNFEVKNKLAMTYLSTSNPMQGIMMLRDILDNDPENEHALFNLGTLSMQSGQYDKAVERFSDLVSLYPNNTKAQFFLGVSYLETGNKLRAREQFNLVKSLDKDPSVQATVESYLEELE